MTQQDKLEAWLATQAFAWPTPLQIWQASRTAALEEAARICDDEVYADRAGRRIRVLAKGESDA